MALLETRELSRTFGGLVAVSRVDFSVESNEIVGLIGPNGAGKTTLFNVITGVYKPSAGHVRFKEQDIAGLLPSRVTKLGIARTFQSIRLFNGMSAIENVMVARHSRTSTSVFGAVLRTRRALREEREARTRSEYLLEYVGLAAQEAELAKNLAYGSQRRLEIARAMATDPELLFLDEPAAGMNPHETAELMELIRRIRSEGMTIILIEHDMRVVMGISDRVVVLDQGEKIADGRPDEVRADPRVIAAYLGKSA